MTPKGPPSKTYTQPVGGGDGASLIDLQSPPIQRQDTGTNSVDEFVDAEP